MSLDFKSALNALKQIQSTYVESEKEKVNYRLENEMRRGLTKRYIDVSWDGFIADTESKKRAIFEAKKAWEKNLLLSGKSGTGKTYIAMCLLKDGATYKRLADIFREIRLNFDNEAKIISKLGGTKLLVIDEIGRQKFSDFEKNMFFEIIDRRWNNMLNTTLITNLNINEFASEFSSAVIDRLRPTVVTFDWESRR